MRAASAGVMDIPDEDEKDLHVGGKRKKDNGDSAAASPTSRRERGDDL